LAWPCRPVRSMRSRPRAPRRPELMWPLAQPERLLASRPP
jgi:hypothetical protein